jgi:FKBP-type peptidyl-prolyl cis-trans isomerase
MEKLKFESNMQLKKNLIALFAVSGLLIAFACSDKDDNTPNAYEQLGKEVAAIDQYLQENGRTAIRDVSGIRMVIMHTGSGLPAQNKNTVKVNYTGRLFSTGTIFDQGTTTGSITQYIDGWKVALKTLPAGSVATLYIPSYYAYGTQPLNGIPANSTLVFDITSYEVIYSDSERLQFTADTTAIDQYLANKSINAIKDNTGIRYVINQTGTGAVPSWYDQVSIKYTVKLMSTEATVGNAEEQPTENFASRVIDYLNGIKAGLRNLQNGSKATLYIPSAYGFGAEEVKNQSGQVIVPANSNLIIEIELKDVKLQ